jgi:hypothetical protein
VRFGNELFDTLNNELIKSVTWEKDCRHNKKNNKQYSEDELKRKPPPGRFLISFTSIVSMTDSG